MRRAKIFYWMGKDRLTIGAIIRLLKEGEIRTRKGKIHWDRSTIWYMLKNPAYKGQAAFGRKKTGTRLAYVRPRRDSSEHPKNNSSRYAVDKDEWIYISVPAIIDENLFHVVQEQLEENRKRARVHKSGETYLLQGLLVCQCCGRAYCGGKTIKRYTNKETIYLYYRCTGTDAARFGGTKMCHNKQVGAAAVELVIWEEVKKLLKNPQRILEEYQRRLLELDKSPVDEAYTSLEKRRIKLEKGISLLIDSYTQQYITKDEFEPRIQMMRKNLKIAQEQHNKLMGQKNLTKEIELTVKSLAHFTSGIAENLDQLNWHGKRDMMRCLVKRVELTDDEINVVYKVSKLPESKNDSSLQHRCNRTSGFASSVGGSSQR
jgi:site-specific DNA recombinase